MIRQAAFGLQTFTHEKTGETLEVCFRPFRDSDAPAVVALIRCAYGESYVKPYLYDEKRVIDANRDGSLIFTMATTRGGVIGMLGLEQSSDFPGQYEYVTQVIDNSYRGYGIAAAHISRGMLMDENKGHTALYGHALTCHAISQITMRECGFAVSGFIFSIFDARILQTAFPVRGASRISQVILMKAQDKRESSPLWIPPEYEKAFTGVYRRMGTPYTCLPAPLAAAASSSIRVNDDATHRTRSIYLDCCGDDANALLRRLMSQARENHAQAVNAFLNLSAAGAGLGYEALKANGFYVSGLQPLGTNAEYLVLHNPLSNINPLVGLRLSGESQALLDELDITARDAASSGRRNG